MRDANYIDKFDNWNELKQDIHFSDVKEFYVKAKQVWYIHKWMNIWYESNWKWLDFKRPVLVLKKVGNLFFVVSMTTKWKDNNKFYHRIDDSYFWKKSYIVLSQVKVVDKKRFLEEIWEISWEDFRKIKKEIQNLLL